MYYLFFTILFLVCQSGSAQNLLPNGGFEEENICVEYKHNCAPEAWIANSLYANYYYYTPGQAFEGTHFIGLSAGQAYQEGARNFIRTQLLCGLRPGHQYQLSFYLRSRHQVLDSVGAYFTANDFLFEKKNFKTLQPQLWAINALDTLYEDPTAWQLVRLIYTATGEENFLTIGSFNRKEHKFRGRPDFHRDYYFYLDAVSLVPLDPQEKLCGQMDSIKTAIYNENQRHEFLKKQIYARSKNPPPAPVLPKTIQSAKPPRQRIDTLVIPDIFFATASYQLAPVSHGLLDSLAQKLIKTKIDSVVIEGHTDTIGKLAYNETLSVNRAMAVKNYLLAQWPTAHKPIFIYRGFAFRKPVSTNNTPAGRRKNRRVEIYIYRKED